MVNDVTLPDDCACILLAGGRSSRMGRDKASLPFAGRTLLEHVVVRVAPLVAEVVVVAAADQTLPLVPDAASSVAVRVVRDPVPGEGPLPALAAGLAAITRPWAFTLACDGAFVSPELLRALAADSAGDRAVIPTWRGRLQPLVALYSRTLASDVAALARSGERRLHAIATLPGVRTVDDARVALRDPDGRSFRTINTPDEYARAVAEVTGSGR